MLDAECSIFLDVYAVGRSKDVNVVTSAVYPTAYNCRLVTSEQLVVTLQVSTCHSFSGNQTGCIFSFQYPLADCSGCHEIIAFQVCMERRRAILGLHIIQTLDSRFAYAILGLHGIPGLHRNVLSHFRHGNV